MHMRHMLLVFIVYLVVGTLGAKLRAAKGRDILDSQNLHLFSNGVLEYAPEEDLLCSFLDGIGCLGRKPKPKTVRINLSQNLEIQRKEAKTLQIIDIVTNEPLSGFPGAFNSPAQLTEWEQQIVSIIKYTASYKQYIGISLNDKICLTYSGSPIFCGVAVFIGNIRSYDPDHAPYFAIRITEKEMIKRNVNHHIDEQMISNGLFNDVRYFNYMDNTLDTFIIINASQVFYLHQCLSVDPLTKRLKVLAEAKDFFTLTMPQIWQNIEEYLKDKDILIPTTNQKLHVDGIDLSRLNVRLFNYESSRSLSHPSFNAKLKVFGSVDIALHFRTSSGRKYSKSDLKITEIYLEGDVNVNYQFKMRQHHKQQLQIGFLQKPLVQILKSSNIDEFPTQLIGTLSQHPIDWLQTVIETLLETRGIKNVISWNIGSPFD